jgi:16S rRNA U1498 N3-methylase RsmE
MHRFKINKNEIDNARAPLSQEEAAHALKVLRLRDGETVQALDGEGGMWMACLRVMDGKNAYLELKEAISASIRAKESDLVGNMASQGTTPRQLTDLIGSLCDLTSGSGDKGTPVVLVQGYFDNYTDM